MCVALRELSAPRSQASIWASRSTMLRAGISTARHTARPPSCAPLVLLAGDQIRGSLDMALNFGAVETGRVKTRTDRPRVMLLAYWFTQHEHGGFPVERAVRAPPRPGRRKHQLELTSALIRTRTRRCSGRCSCRCRSNSRLSCTPTTTGAISGRRKDQRGIARQSSISHSNAGKRQFPRCG